MKTYPRYKDSGVNWLGKIPEGWESYKFKYLFKEKKKETNIGLNCGAISFGKIIYKDDDKIPLATKKSYQVLNKGEFLINPLNLNYDLISLRIALSDKDVVVSSGYIVLKEIVDIDKDYFKFLLHVFDVSYMKTLGSGVRQTLSFNHISNSELPLPPKPEQKVIVNFLDKTCGKLDTVVAQKKKMIALLKERKQALIQNAVTRGLNENVPMKDSGVDWIGEIPKNWKVKRLKFICVLNKESLPENLNKKQKINYVDIGSVTFEDGILSTEYYLFQNAPSRARKVAENGDTIVSTVRTYLKAVDFIDKNKSKYVYSTGFAILSPNKNILNKYLYNQVRADAFTEQVSYNSKGMSYPAINSTDLGRIWVCVPPKQEQEKIVNYIDAQSQKIDQAVKQQEQAIIKLKEYKASLINSCVLGKIKVS
jgi:type I restriction enzyme S subunit